VPGTICRSCGRVSMIEVACMGDLMVVVVLSLVVLMIWKEAGISEHGG
jgi:hypothetical protein